MASIDPITFNNPSTYYDYNSNGWTTTATTTGTTWTVGIPQAQVFPIEPAYPLVEEPPKKPKKSKKPKNNVEWLKNRIAEVCDEGREYLEAA